METVHILLGFLEVEWEHVISTWQKSGPQLVLNQWVAHPFPFKLHSLAQEPAVAPYFLQCLVEMPLLGTQGSPWLV